MNAMILVKMLLLARIVFGCEMTITGDGPYYSLRAPSGIYKPGLITATLSGSDCMPNTPEHLAFVVEGRGVSRGFPVSTSMAVMLGVGNSDPALNYRGYWHLTALDDSHPFAGNEVTVTYITPKPTVKAYGCYYDTDRHTNYMQIGAVIDDPRREDDRSRQLLRYFQGYTLDGINAVSGGSYDGQEVYGETVVEPNQSYALDITAGVNDSLSGQALYPIVDSDPVRLEFTTPSSCPPISDFKVLYKGKEYLFDDCAPLGVNDSCRSGSIKDDFKGGEFLLGDHVELNAEGNTNLPSNPTYEWVVTRLSGCPENCAVPIQGTGAKVYFDIPTDAEADYEISLNITGSKSKVRSLPKVKKIKAKAQISPDYLESPFSMSNLKVPFGNHRSPKELISGYGCYLVNTTSLFKESMPILPNGLPISPVEMDELYFQERAYRNINELKLDLAAGVQNKYGARYDVDYKFFGTGSWNKEKLEEMARKRTLAMLEVHSVNLRNLPVTKPWREISACNKGDTAKKLEQIEKALLPEGGTQKAQEACHKKLKHVIILKGISYADGLLVLTSREFLYHFFSYKFDQYFSAPWKFC